MENKKDITKDQDLMIKALLEAGDKKFKGLTYDDMVQKYNSPEHIKKGMIQFYTEFVIPFAIYQEFCKYSGRNDQP